MTEQLDFYVCDGKKVAFWEVFLFGRMFAACWSGQPSWRWLAALAALRALAALKKS